MIDEPIGWDNIVMRLKRDKTWQGFFDFFGFDSAEIGGMQFINDAADVLKTAYEFKGVEAYVVLKIEFACSDTDDYELLYSGRFSFESYKFVCGEMCYVECGIEDGSCLMTFRNRYDQKVNVDDISGFDEDCQVIAEDVIVNFTTPGTIVFPTILIVDLTGKRIVISGSDSNDGVYTVLTFSNGGGFCTITVDPLTISEADQTITVKSYCLPAYDGLNKEIVMPSKTILFANDWEITSDFLAYSDEILYLQPGGIVANYAFGFDWAVDNLTDIPTSNRLRVNGAWLSGATAPLFLYAENYEGIINFDLSENLDCSGEVDIEIEIDGLFELNSIDAVQFDGTILLSHIYADGTAAPAVTLQSGLGCAGCNTTSDVINVSYSGTKTIRKGDRLFLWIAVTNMQYTTGPTQPFDIEITIDSASLKVKAATKCEQTTAKVYMINETLSRVSEIITNDCLRVYSDYYGRTDAEPYPSDENGCAGLRCFTSGQKIRLKDRPAFKLDLGQLVPKFTVSMKDLFDGLNAIDNIGLGIEDDPNRTGEQLIRIEQVRYFYNNTVAMECLNARELTREVNMSKIFSIIKIGYDKWETENVNGLNDVFGKREFRTSLKSIRNNYERISKLIASDYAIEITRRQYGTSTKDWKYDNDTFIICLKDNQSTILDFYDTNKLRVSPDDLSTLQIGDVITITGTVSNNGNKTISNITVTGVFRIFEFTTGITNEVVFANVQSEAIKAVEQGGVTSSSNIMYPNEAFNLRITPARNLIRHLKTLLTSYKAWLASGIYFTNGDGNYQASIELALDCLNEDGALSEGLDLFLAQLDTPSDHYPIFDAETVKFAYPMSYSKYVFLKANKYGVVRYSCNGGATEDGYIEDLGYKPYDGEAEFTLTPKIVP